MEEKKKFLIPILGGMAFLANGDNYAAAPLILNIAQDLELSVQTAAYSVTAYMLAFGLFTLLFGPASDRYGKVKIINIAALGTALFSILGGFAFNFQSLVLFRAVNGAFAAGIFPVTMALVGQSFGAEGRHKALGKVMGLMFLGGATATAIGGILSYFGSWRIVYIVYGVAELIVALVMLRFLERDKGIIDHLNFIKVYAHPFRHHRFMRLVGLIFLVGFAVFGSFTYSGKLLQELTGYTVLQVGLVLSFFGIGTVAGGRIAPRLKQLLKHGFLVAAGFIGFAALLSLSAMENIVILSISLFLFGVAFIFLQSTLISTAQAKLPAMRGTAMSLASFNMFVGGAAGTAFNGYIMVRLGIPRVFLIASFAILTVGLLGALFVARFEMRQKAEREQTG